jgi:hypothetical protein
VLRWDEVGQIVMFSMLSFFGSPAADNDHSLLAFHQQQTNISFSKERDYSKPRYGLKIAASSTASS